MWLRVKRVVVLGCWNTLGCHHNKGSLCYGPNSVKHQLLRGCSHGENLGLPALSHPHCSYVGVVVGNTTNKMVRFSIVFVLLANKLNVSRILKKG